MRALAEFVMRGRREALLVAVTATMLPMFFYLKAAVAPTGVFAATEDWGSTESGLVRRVRRAGTQFAELIANHPAVDHADEFANVPDFSTLLNG